MSAETPETGENPQTLGAQEFEGTAASQRSRLKHRPALLTCEGSSLLPPTVKIETPQVRGFFAFGENPALVTSARQPAQGVPTTYVDSRIPAVALDLGIVSERWDGPRSSFEDVDTARSLRVRRHSRGYAGWALAS
jgi:hypothetical protein